MAYIKCAWAKTTTFWTYFIPDVPDLYRKQTDASLLFIPRAPYTVNSATTIQQIYLYIYLNFIRLRIIFVSGQTCDNIFLWTRSLQSQLYPQLTIVAQLVQRNREIVSISNRRKFILSNGVGRCDIKWVSNQTSARAKKLKSIPL